MGRLQTDADRARVIDGLGSADGATAEGARALGAVVKRLAPRWFVMRDAHTGPPVLVQPRYAMSLLRGPMTRGELEEARERREAGSASTIVRDRAGTVDLSVRT